jgi:hypothetical protein
MRLFRFPGSDVVRDEVLQYIYELACHRGGSTEKTILVSIVYFNFSVPTLRLSQALLTSELRRLC